jgi:hypothetical protein
MHFVYFVICRKGILIDSFLLRKSIICLNGFKLIVKIQITIGFCSGWVFNPNPWWQWP